MCLLFLSISDIGKNVSRVATSTKESTAVSSCAFSFPLRAVVTCVLARSEHSHDHSSFLRCCLPVRTAHYCVLAYLRQLSNRRASEQDQDTRVPPPVAVLLCPASVSAFASSFQVITDVAVAVLRERVAMDKRAYPRRSPRAVPQVRPLHHCHRKKLL